MARNAGDTRLLEDGHPLLMQLRNVARPDRARVAAYVSLTRASAGWAAYTEFLRVHRSWIAALARSLATAGWAAPEPLPDGAEVFAAGAAEVPDEPVLSGPRSPAEAAGYLYVLESFRLGCSVLAQRLGTERTAAAEPSGIRGRPWRELVAALDRVAPEHHAAAVQGAREAFAAWERELAPWLAHLGVGPLSADAHAA